MQICSTMVDASLVNANLAANASIAFSKLAALNSAQILVGNGSNVATAVAVTGDIGINNAGLTSITAGAIVNADVSSTAAIAGSKITTGTTSAVGVLQLTDSTSSTSATTAATPNAVKTAYDLANAALPKAGGTMTGNLIVDNAKEVRFSEADSNGANYLGLKAPASVTADLTWTLPDGDGSSGQFLKTDGSGNLSWGTDSTVDSTKLPLAGGTMSGAINMGSQNITNAGTITGTFSGNLTGNVTGNASGSAATVTGATQSAITSVGTLTGLTVSGNISMTGTGVLDIPVGTTGERPGSPSTGMFRYNSTLNQFEGYKNTGWGEIGGGAGATGGSTDEVFMENDQTVTTNYTLGSNKNAVSVGNLTVNNGVTITIPSNATWVVL